MEGGKATSPGWTSLTAATGWLTSRTAFRATGLPGSLTGAGLRNVSPSGVMPQLRAVETQSTPGLRNSGTSVDSDGVEFITPKMVAPNHAIMPKSYTDGILRRSSVSDEKEIAALRDTVENLCEELERQKSATERLQDSVSLHQRLISDLLTLEERLTHQQQELLEADRRHSPAMGLSLLGVCTLVGRTLLSWTPLPYILSLLDAQHLTLWLNKCLKLLVSFLLYILFKSWLRVWGLGEIVNKIEAFVFKMTRILLSPFKNETNDTSSLMWERDKRLRRQ